MQKEVVRNGDRRLMLGPEPTKLSIYKEKETPRGLWTGDKHVDRLYPNIYSERVHLAVGSWTTGRGGGSKSSYDDDWTLYRPQAPVKYREQVVGLMHYICRSAHRVTMLKTLVSDG